MQITEADEEQREVRTRRFWRGLLLLLLLSVLCYACFTTYQQLAARHLAIRQDDYLALAGPIAEEAELNINEAALAEGELQQILLPALFESFPDLAAVRIWSPAGGMKCEMTRRGKKAVLFSVTPTLTDLGAREALLRQAKKTTAKNWSDPIAQLQIVEGEQRDISSELDLLFDYGDLHQKRAEIYRRQERMLTMVSHLNISSEMIKKTRDSMNQVLDALPRGREELPTAILASAAVLENLTAALTSYRASISRVSILPRSLSRYSFYKKDWLSRLLPIVQGERILIPLYAPAISSSLLEPVGTLETIHYYRPAAALRLVRWKDAIWPGILLLLILLLAFWPRAREEESP